MKKTGHLLLSFAVAVFFLAVAAGCSSDTSTRDSGDGTGSLTLFLADAPAQNYLAVYVTIEEVQVHTPGNGEGQGGWKTVGTPGETYDLLELVNGVVGKLGKTELDAGRYNQLRMILSDEPDGGENILGNEHPHPNYFIDDTGAKELKVPSGYQTGIKLVSGFTIYEGENTELILDFDAHRSVVKAGKSGKYLLKPTIKVVGVYDSAIVAGTVTDDSDDLNPIADAIVSAQVPNAESDADRVFTATRTADGGGYKMHLPPDDYAIIAYKGTTDQGSKIYGPACRWLEAGYGVYDKENFILEEVDSVTLSIDMENIFADATEEEAIFSIRALKAIQCDNEELTIEVASLFLQHQDEDVVMVLPPGIYTIRAATGEEVWQKTVNLEANETESIEFLSDHAK